MPTLAVCMPNFNQARLIKRAIEAVLKQTRLPDEFFIIDDHSSDESAGVIESYVRKNPWIVFLRHTANKGVASIFEEAVILSKSDYIYGGASDDYVFPHFFEKAIEWAGRFPSAGIVFGKMVVVDPAGKRLTTLQARSWQTPGFISPQDYMSGYLERESPMHSLCGATLYRKDFIQGMGIGRFQDLGHWYDSFVARTLALRHGACYLAQEASAWSVLPGSMTQSAIRKKADMVHIVERAAHYMRSGEFKSIYPEAYVEKWRRGYLKAVDFICRPWAIGAAEAAMKLAPYPFIGVLARVFEKELRVRILNRF